MPKIKQFEEFADSREFALLVEFIHSAGIKVKRHKNTAKWDRFCFDALPWRPAHYELSPAQVADPFELYHHGFHYLIARHYGADLFQRPLVTLMTECLVSSLEIYFAIHYLETKGARHPSVQRYVSMCTRSAGIEKERLFAFLKKSKGKAFATYREVCLEIFGFCELLLKWCSIVDPSELQHREFKKGLKRLRFRYLYEYLMFEVYMIFVLGYCTSTSSKSDRRDIRDIRHRLAKAQTMFEFMSGLRMPR